MRHFVPLLLAAALITMALPPATSAATPPDATAVVVSVDRVDARVPGQGWALVTARDLTISLSPLDSYDLAFVASNFAFPDGTSSVRLLLIEGAPQYVRFSDGSTVPLLVPRLTVTITNWEAWTSCNDPRPELTVTRKGSSAYSLAPLIRVVCD